MNDNGIAKRIKEFRVKLGMTQEALAEKSGLSLRTVQRIENEETVPRGDSLKRLAVTLGSSPDALIDWKVQKDNGYLSIMNLSALGFLFFPILGIVVPLIFWVLKKDKLKGVDTLGKRILNFQISWCLLFFGYYIVLFTGILGRVIGLFSSTKGPGSFIVWLIPVLLLYGYNIVLIILNTVRVYKGKKAWYKPAIRFFR